MAPADFKNRLKMRYGCVVVACRQTLDEPAADTNWDETWAWWDTAIQAHKDAGMKYLVVAGYLHQKR